MYPDAAGSAQLPRSQGCSRHQMHHAAALPSAPPHTHLQHHQNPTFGAVKGHARSAHIHTNHCIPVAPPCEEPQNATSPCLLGHGFGGSFCRSHRSGVTTAGSIANFFRDAGKRAGKAPARPASSGASAAAPTPIQQFGLAGVRVVRSSQGHAAVPPPSAPALPAGSATAKAKKRLCLSRSKQRRLSRPGKTKVTAVAGTGTAAGLHNAASAGGRGSVEPPLSRAANELSTKRLSLGTSADRPAKRGCGLEADGMSTAGFARVF